MLVKTQTMGPVQFRSTIITSSIQIVIVVTLESITSRMTEGF